MICYPINCELFFFLSNLPLKRIVTAFNHTMTGFKNHTPVQLSYLFCLNVDPVEIRDKVMQYERIFFLCSGFVSVSNTKKGCLFITNSPDFDNKGCML